MGSEQFSQAVRGSGGRPIQTSAAGSIETDNYDHGDSFEFDGSAYPYTVEPADTDTIIQVAMLTISADVDMVVTTIEGDEFAVRLDGVVGSFSDWEIDALTFEDPRGTGATVAGAWAGEPEVSTL